MGWGGKRGERKMCEVDSGIALGGWGELTRPHTNKVCAFPVPSVVATLASRDGKV